MSKLNTLQDALVNELKDLRNAEQQLLKALPQMQKKASNESLKEAISSHLTETEEHCARLEQIGKIMDISLSGKTCKAMQGLIAEGSEVLKEDGNDVVLDALIIGSAQRVEHYEIAAYGTARAMAEELGLKEVAQLLSETLDEESAADTKLSEISESEVLPLANSEEQNEQDEEVSEKKRPSKSNSMHANKGPRKNVSKTLSVAFAVFALAASPRIGLSETRNEQIRNEREAAQHAPDSSGRNARDVNDYRKTADSQSFAGKEVEVLANVRKEILANDELSTNAKNVKIIVDKGVITLRGPVQSPAERNWIQEATARIANGYKIVNQLEISAG